MPFLRRLPPLFHLGLLPVVCLLWLWADSTTHVARWEYQPRGSPDRKTLASEGSALHYRRYLFIENPLGNKQLPPGDPRQPGTSFPGKCRRAPLNATMDTAAWPLFPAPDHSTMVSTYYDHWNLSLSSLILPFWLLLLCYLPPWLLLAWWQARRRRGRNSGDER